MPARGQQAAEGSERYEQVRHELADARRGKIQVSVARLGELYQQIRAWDYGEEAYGDAPLHPLVEDLCSLLRPLSDERDAANLAAACDYSLAQLIEREVSRSDAIRRLQATIGTHDAGLPVVPIMYVTLAGMERDEGLYDVAREHLASARSALEFQEARDLPRYSELVRLMLDLENGALHLSLGMPDVAGKPLRRAQEEAARLADPDLWFRSVLYRMHLHLQADDFARVRAVYEDYVVHPLRASLPEDAHAQALLRLGFARLEEEYLAPQRRASAPESDGLETSVELLEAALAVPGLKNDEAIRGRARLATALLDRDRIREAQLALEAARGLLPAKPSDFPPYAIEWAGVWLRAHRLAEPSMDSAAMLEELGLPVLESLLSHLEAQPLRTGGVAYLQFEGRNVFLSELIELELTVHGLERGARRAFGHVTAVQARGSLARRHAMTAPSSERIQETWLRADQGLLMWSFGSRQSHLFVADSEGPVRIWRLKGAAELELLARKLVASIDECLRDPSLEQTVLTAASRRATGAFLPDGLLPQLSSWGSLLLVGLDGLGYLPVEALKLDGGYLGEALAVSYLPSVPVGEWLRQRAAELERTRARDLHLWVGDGRPDGTFPVDSQSVHETRTAVSELERIYRSDRVAVTHGTELADLAPLADAFLAAHTFQFIGHGVYDPERERPAGLMFAPTLGSAGVVFGGELDSLKAPPFVFLAACGASRSRLRRGDDGRGSLGGAFLDAGAVSVTLSFLNQEAGAAGEFATRIHRQLETGASVDAALLQARRSSRPGDYGVPRVHAMLAHTIGWGSSSPFPDRAAETNPFGVRSLLLLGLGSAVALLWVRARGRASHAV